MNNTNIIPFLFDETTIRVVMQNDEPWFVATDIAVILGYSSAKDMTRMLDNDEKGGHLVPTLGGKQEMITITEPGLYQVIMKSKKEEAKSFQRWVAHEVLPSIRKTGRYESNKSLSVNRLIKLQQQSWKLMSAIKAARESEMRDFLYGQLEAVSQEMALLPPSLARLGAPEKQMNLEV